MNQKYNVDHIEYLKKQYDEAEVKALNLHWKKRTPEQEKEYQTYVKQASICYKLLKAFT